MMASHGMSAPDGHSVRQRLQFTQASSTSLNLGESRIVRVHGTVQVPADQSGLGPAEGPLVEDLHGDRAVGAAFPAARADAARLLHRLLGQDGGRGSSFVPVELEMLAQGVVFPADDRSGVEDVVRVEDLLDLFERGVELRDTAASCSGSGAVRPRARR